MENKILNWEYKHGDRETYVIKCTEYEEHELDFTDSKDVEWRFQVYREDCGKLVQIYDGFFMGQYDLEPLAQELMEEFISYMSGLTIGFSVNGVKIV